MSEKQQEILSYRPRQLGYPWLYQEDNPDEIVIFNVPPEVRARIREWFQELGEKYVGTKNVNMGEVYEKLTRGELDNQEEIKNYIKLKEAYEKDKGKVKSERIKLNVTSSLIWEKCDGVHLVSDIIDEIMDEFQLVEAKKAKVEYDVINTLKQFEEKKLIQLNWDPF